MCFFDASILAGYFFQNHPPTHPPPPPLSQKSDGPSLIIFSLMIHFQFCCHRCSNSCCKITLLLRGVSCDNLTAMTKVHPARLVPFPFPLPCPQKMNKRQGCNVYLNSFEQTVSIYFLLFLKNPKTAMWIVIFHRQSG